MRPPASTPPRPIASRVRNPSLPRLAALTLTALTLVALAAVIFGARSLTNDLRAQSDQRSLGDTTDAAVSGARFSLVDFELQSVLNRWLGDLGAFFTGSDESGDRADSAVQRYFDLRVDLSDARAAGRSPESIVALQAQRDAIENQVERILEDRVGREFRALGFSRPLPLFDGQDILWPPVDVELTSPPRVLTVSPRDDIRIARSVLLDPDLSLDEIERIEAAVEADGRWSALVDTIGGLGAYPAIVRDTRSYASTVDTIAHEWTHNYLFFYPLGFHFFDNRDLRTINETVANMVAAEVAHAVLIASPAVQPRSLPALDRTESDAILFQLRRDVDDLIADGRIEQAEALMESTRRELVAIGRNFRRINQAFFAANGVYADTPASSSPIGPLLRALRDDAGSLTAFIAVVREVDSLADLESAVAKRP